MAGAGDDAALIVVDVQNDFLPGGALAVPGGDAVVPVANALRDARPWRLVALTRDQHPPGHVSFASRHPGAAPFTTITLPPPSGARQEMWPDHCVAGEAGAAFGPGLVVREGDLVVDKGANPEVDAYSGFDSPLRGPDGGDVPGGRLGAALRAAGVRRVAVCGLATDFCVLATSLDARRLGFRTVLVRSGARPVNERGGAEAEAKMAAAGVVLVDGVEDALRALGAA